VASKGSIPGTEVTENAKEGDILRQANIPVAIINSLKRESGYPRIKEVNMDGVD
jgi:hypothetical protein